MTTKDYPPKTKEELLEIAKKLQEESTARKQKIAQMEAVKAKALSGKEDENKDTEEKENADTKNTPVIVNIPSLPKVEPIKKDNEGSNGEKNKLNKKQAEDLLKKIKVDEVLVKNKEKEFIDSGYPEVIAKELATIWSVIDASNRRINIYESCPEVKDAEKRLSATKKTYEENTAKFNEVLKNNIPEKKDKDTKNIDTTTGTKELSDQEKSISNKQKIRNAEEEIRKISSDEKNIHETKIALINQGYKEAEALEMAQLMDTISQDEKRKEIFLNNPKIQNGQKELIKIEKRLEENKIKLESLKTNKTKQPTQAENQKESALKNTKEKILAFFRRKEKQKVEVYTEEEEKAWVLMLKTELEKGTSKEEVQNLILKHNEEKRKLEVENGPLSPRIKSGITNLIKDWDNWGSEGGWSGYTKKMLKMGFSIALITGFSNLSVEFGVGTASALGGGRIVKKMLIGLGLGTAMELTNGMTPEKRKKLQKIVSLGMMAISAGIAIGTGGGIVAGAAVGGSAAFGYISSKLVQKQFSEEKIKAKVDAIKNRPINIATLEEDLFRIEKETKEILKYAEKTRLLRKLVGGTVAVGASIGMIEASGFVHDLKTEHHQQEQQKIDDFNDKHEANVKHIADMNEKHLQHEAEMKHNAEQQVKNDSETQTNQPEADNQTPETGTNNVTQNTNIQEFMKSSATQDAIKLGMYTPGEENESMNVQSGKIYFDAPGHHIEVPYSSDGAIQTIADLKEKMIAEFGGEEKIPHGNMTTHYVDMKGIEHDQALIYHDTNGIETIDKYNGTMIDSDHSSTNIENTNETPEQIEAETGLSTEENLPRVEIDPQTGFLIEKADSDETTGFDQNTDNGENIIEKETNNLSEIKLTPDMLEQVERISEYNIDRVFPTDEAINQWYNIQTTEATLITHMSVEDADEIYKPLVEYVHNLQKITGITDPYEATLIKPAENISQYIERALEKAISDPKIGLDKVTL